MDEEKNKSIDNDASTFGALLSEKEMAAANLKVLIEKLEGEDKCVVCHAIKLLEQKESSDWSSNFWTILIILLCMFGFSGTNSFVSSSDFLNILNESLKKYNDDIEKGQES